MALRLWKRLQWVPMRRALLLFLLVFLFAPAARAQELGNVGLRAFQQSVFNAASCSAAPLNVEIQNRGLTSHFVIYQTAGTINSLSIEIQGRNDGTLTWQRISDADVRTSAGAVWANVYLNFIRVSLTACSGTGTISATYSGTSVAVTPSGGGLFLPNSQSLLNRSPFHAGRALTMFQETGGATSSYGDGFTALGGIAGRCAPNANTSVPYAVGTTTAILNSDGGFRGGEIQRTGNNLYGTAVLAYGAFSGTSACDTDRLNTPTAQRVWIGLTSNAIASGTQLGSATPTGSYAMFRWDTSVPDTNIQCVTANAGTLTVTDSGVAGNSTVWRRYEVQEDTPNAQWRFYLNGTLVCTNTTNLPPAGVNLGMFLGVRTLAAAQKELHYSLMYVEKDEL